MNRSGSKPGVPSKNPLPPKEAGLFKQILKHYEEKNYKKGLKACDAILKKFPEHGETLAMKGLIQNSFESRKKEAYDLVKKGLRHDISSAICWHVYGLLYRSDREYIEAIKCYQQALKRDSENQQILRDLAILQAQIRDIKGLLETRKLMLKQKPTNRPNWIAYIVAAHLAGDIPRALQLLEGYESTLNPEQEEIKPFDFEHSELLLYKVSLLEEQGDYEAALQYLKRNQKFILDKVVYGEKTAHFLLKLGRYEESQKSYHDLITTNTEKWENIYGYFRAHKLEITGNNLSDEMIEHAAKIFEQLESEFPKSQAIKLIPLSILKGDQFKAKLEAHLIAGLRKGLPSLFMSIKSLYKRKEVPQVIEEILLGYYNSLKATGALPNSQDKKETPLTLLWTLQLLANHFDLQKDFQKALQFVDEAIAHTPTALDLYLTKGRIFKHAGDPVEAAALFDKVRKLDLADRYLNTRCTLYQIRADDVDTADKTIALFTREGESSGQTSLFDMQCMWYELETGESYLRTKQFGRALKRFTWVEKHFADFVEDQLDFHNYCLRKMTLRSYNNLIQFVDKLYSHKNFSRAAAGIIRTYLAIHETPKTAPQVTEDEEFAGLSEAEKKKAISKKRRQQAKEKEQQTNQEKQPTPAELKKAEEDKEAEALASVEDPLAEAAKYVNKALQHAPQNIDIHLLAIEVFIRRSKFSLALRSLKKVRALAPESPDLHLLTVKFFNAVQHATNINDQVAQLIKLEGEEAILGGKSLKEFNKDAFSKSAAHRIAGAEGLLVLEPQAKTEAISLLADTEGGLTYQLATKVLRLLETLDASAANAYKEKAHKLFPYCSAFAPPKPVEETAPSKAEDDPKI